MHISQVSAHLVTAVYRGAESQLPLLRALVRSSIGVQVRARRRAGRLKAIRTVLESIGAGQAETRQTFLVNPRTLAPAAFEGLKLMCREFGGFEANVLESAAASTVALDTDWRPIRDGAAIAVMAEATARTLRADGVAVVPIQPPPQYVIALAWRRDEQAAAAHRFLAYLRRYRDRHA